MIRGILAGLAAISMWTVPATAAQIIGGAGGTLRIVVTSGFFDADGPFGSNSSGDVKNLAGFAGTLVFFSKIKSGVPRNYEPFGTFQPYYINSFRLTLNTSDGNLVFSHTDSNNQPNPADTYHWVSSTGNEQQGTLMTYYGENAGRTRRYDLSYQNNGKTGAGIVQIGHEDYGQTVFAAIDYTVIDGQVFAGVPEPRSWALLIAGLGVAGGMRRRQRNALAV